MSKIRVHCFGISLDGFSAGPDQDLDHPLGVNGLNLMQWFFPTRVFQKMHGGGEDGTTGIDNDFAERSFKGIGAWIMGRNMFGPVRGAWPDDSWKGWWGDSPPYHTQVFVLTHHARPPLAMAGGTTFHFVTDGIHAALQRAKAAAGELDIRIGGGPATVRQYLQAGLIDEMHLVASPAVLGSGERLLEGIDLVKLGYRCREQVMSPAAMHVLLAK
jgi:dihydrofolate reductase